MKDSEWSEFESSRLFQDLAAYAERLHLEKERMRTALHEQEYKEETVLSHGRQYHHVWFQSLLARVSKLFHRT